MISVMTAKWVADAFGKDGIYSVWIAIRKYPWLPPVDYRDKGETAAQVMTPVERLVVIEDGCTLRELGGYTILLASEDCYVLNLDTTDNRVKKYNFHGFPVVKGADFIGYVTRDKLMLSIESLLSREPAPLFTRRCTFLSRRPITQDDSEDLSNVVEEAVLQLRKEQPQELVVDMFQKLVSVASLQMTSTSYGTRTEPSTNFIHARRKTNWHGHKDRYCGIVKSAFFTHWGVVGTFWTPS